MNKNKGFLFTPSSVSGKSKMRKSSGCGACGLMKDCPSPKMEPEGPEDARILIILDSPLGESEWLPGPLRMFLKRELFRVGIKLEDDCLITGAICCNPLEEREPNREEMAHCRPRLEKVLEERKPEIILLFGKGALDAYWFTRLPEAPGSVHKWRGLVVPDGEQGARVISLFSLSYVNDLQEKQPVVSVIFRQDLRTVAEIFKTSPPRPVRKDYRSLVKIEYDLNKAKRLLVKARTDAPSFLAFDFETNGLKPWDPGHFIECVAVSYGPENTFAVPFREETAPHVARLLTHSSTGKIAHNLSFESIWSLNKMKIEVFPWSWDTMMASHVLHNRTGGNGLDFLVLTTFGVTDYFSHLDDMLRAVDEGKNGANGFNRIKEINRDDLYAYCGQDALFTYMLAQKQMADFGLFDFDVAPPKED